jgi:CRP-like cAMP-binding protein
MLPVDTLIRKLRADTNLTEEGIAVIRSLPIQVKEMRPDTFIVREGDRPTQCCLIVRGFACRSKVAENGKRQILSFHISGDIPDLQSLFLKKMDHDLATISSCTLGFIEHRIVDKLITEHPSVARALWRETLIDSSILREWIVNMGLRQASSRLAHLLAELRERMAAVGLTENETFEFPVTQTELAEALGLTPVHVNRVLQEFRAARVLDLHKNKVTIIDLPEVMATAGFDDSYLHIVRNVGP